MAGPLPRGDYYALWAVWAAVHAARSGPGPCGPHCRRCRSRCCRRTRMCDSTCRPLSPRPTNRPSMTAACPTISPSVRRLPADDDAWVRQRLAGPSISTPLAGSAVRRRGDVGRLDRGVRKPAPPLAGAQCRPSRLPRTSRSGSLDSRWNRMNRNHGIGGNRGNGVAAVSLLSPFPPVQNGRQENKKSRKQYSESSSLTLRVTMGAVT